METSDKNYFFFYDLSPHRLRAVYYVILQTTTVHEYQYVYHVFYSLQQFKELIDRKTVSLIRPDVSLAGGFT